METSGIVEILNKKLKSLGAKSLCVLYKTKDSPVINAYKEYTWELWHVFNKEKTLLFSIKETFRETCDREEKKNTKVMEENLLNKVYGLLLNKPVIKAIIDGKFDNTD